jgi:hypothetical protein
MPSLSDYYEDGPANQFQIDAAQRASQRYLNQTNLAYGADPSAFNSDRIAQAQAAANNWAQLEPGETSGINYGLPGGYGGQGGQAVNSGFVAPFASGPGTGEQEGGGAPSSDASTPIITPGAISVTDRGASAAPAAAATDPSAGITNTGVPPAPGGYSPPQYSQDGSYQKPPPPSYDERNLNDQLAKGTIQPFTQDPGQSSGPLTTQPYAPGGQSAGPMGSLDGAPPPVQPPAPSDWVPDGKTNYSELPRDWTGQKATDDTGQALPGGQPRYIDSPDGNGLILDTKTGQYFNPQTGQHTKIDLQSRQPSATLPAYAESSSPGSQLPAAYAGAVTPDSVFNPGYGQPTSAYPYQANPYVQGQMDASSGMYGQQYPQSWNRGYNYNDVYGY